MDAILCSFFRGEISGGGVGTFEQHNCLITVLEFTSWDLCTGLYIMKMRMMPGNFSLVPLCHSGSRLTSLWDETRGKKVVLAFWTTLCPRCPSSLSKMEEYALAQPFGSTEFLEICCNDEIGARLMVNATIGSVPSEHRRLKYFYMPFDDKERLRELIGFTHVPYYVILCEDGAVLYSGSEINLELMIDALGLLP